MYFVVWGSRANRDPRSSSKEIASRSRKDSGFEVSFRLDRFSEIIKHILSFTV